MGSPYMIRRNVIANWFYFLICLPPLLHWSYVMNVSLQGTYKLIKKVNQYFNITLYLATLDFVGTQPDQNQE